jgi:hypothetical protein
VASGDGEWTEETLGSEQLTTCAVGYNQLLKSACVCGGRCVRRVTSRVCWINLVVGKTDIDNLLSASASTIGKMLYWLGVALYSPSSCADGPSVVSPLGSSNPILDARCIDANGLRAVPDF